MDQHSLVAPILWGNHVVGNSIGWENLNRKGVIIGMKWIWLPQLTSIEQKDISVGNWFFFFIYPVIVLTLIVNHPLYTVPIPALSCLIRTVPVPRGGHRFRPLELIHPQASCVPQSLNCEFISPPLFYPNLFGGCIFNRSVPCLTNNSTHSDHQIFFPSPTIHPSTIYPKSMMMMMHRSWDARQNTIPGHCLKQRANGFLYNFFWFENKIRYVHT